MATLDGRFKAGAGPVVDDARGVVAGSEPAATPAPETGICDADRVLPFTIRLPDWTKKVSPAIVTGPPPALSVAEPTTKTPEDASIAVIAVLSAVKTTPVRDAAAAAPTVNVCPATTIEFGDEGLTWIVLLPTTTLPLLPTEILWPATRPVKPGCRVWPSSTTPLDGCVIAEAVTGVPLMIRL